MTPRHTHGLNRAVLGFAVTTIAAFAIAISGGTAHAAANTDRLNPNEQLNPGERLVSPDGQFVLSMQSDGNLVEYAPGNRAVWASGTNRGNSIVRMQGDGNLVIIAPGNVAVWATGTGGNTNADLELQSDGNIVVYAQGHVARWSTGVPGVNGADYARAILNNGNIDKSGRLVIQDLQDAANGQNGTAGAPLSATMLRIISQLGQGHTMRITALESGGTGHCNNTPKSSCPNDPHYTGHAVDFGAFDGGTLSGRDAKSVALINTTKTQLPSGSGFGQKQCGATPSLPAGITTFNDTCNHLHVTVSQ